MKKITKKIDTRALILVVLVTSLVMLFKGMTSYRNDAVANGILCIIVTAFALESEFGPRRHLLMAALWSIWTLVLLGWFFGIIGVGAYWLLFLKRKDLGTNTGSDDAEESVSTQTRRTPHIPEADENGTIYECHIKSPHLGITIPWLTFKLARTGGILKVYVKNTFKKTNHAQSLASLCDPEIEGDFFPHVLLHFSVLTLKEHTSKEDKEWMKIPMSSKDAKFLAGDEDDAGFLDQLIRKARVEKRANEGGLYIN